MVKQPASIYKFKWTPPLFLKSHCFDSVRQTSTLLKDDPTPFHNAPFSIPLDRSHYTHTKYLRSRFWRQLETSNILNYNDHQPSTRRRDIHTLHFRHPDYPQHTGYQHRRHTQRLQLRLLYQWRRHRLRDRIRCRTKALRNLWFQQCTLVHHDRIWHDGHPILCVPSRHRHRHDLTSRDLVFRGRDNSHE